MPPFLHPSKRLPLTHLSTTPSPPLLPEPLPRLASPSSQAVGGLPAVHSPRRRRKCCFRLPLRHFFVYFVFLELLRPTRPSTARQTSTDQCTLPSRMERSNGVDRMESCSLSQIATIVGDCPRPLIQMGKSVPSSEVRPSRPHFKSDFGSSAPSSAPFLFSKEIYHGVKDMRLLLEHWPTNPASLSKAKGQILLLDLAQVISVVDSIAASKVAMQDHLSKGSQTRLVSYRRALTDAKITLDNFNEAWFPSWYYSRLQARRNDLVVHHFLLLRVLDNEANGHIQHAIQLSDVPTSVLKDWCMLHLRVDVMWILHFEFAVLVFSFRYHLSLARSNAFLSCSKFLLKNIALTQGYATNNTVFAFFSLAVPLSDMFASSNSDVSSPYRLSSNLIVVCAT
eukprot:SM000288S10786  [mRNA]  locus=s288:41432:43781:- [translate_table: standard]